MARVRRVCQNKARFQRVRMANHFRKFISIECQLATMEREMTTAFTYERSEVLQLSNNCSGV